MTQEHDNSNDPLHAKKKAWSGRFSEPVDAFVLRYTASVDFDKRMAMADIDGSLAHAAMLAKVGVITEQDLADIRRGMAQIREEITSGAFEWQLELEDVHLNIEARLTALIGDAGKRLHTGRSRNDQDDLPIDEKFSSPASNTFRKSWCIRPSSTLASSCRASPTCRSPSP